MVKREEPNRLKIISLLRSLFCLENWQITRIEEENFHEKLINNPRCDEKKPAGSKCLNHSIDCDFLSAVTAWLHHLQHRHRWHLPNPFDSSLPSINPLNAHRRRQTSPKFPLVPNQIALHHCQTVKVPYHLKTYDCSHTSSQKPPASGVADARSTVELLIAVNLPPHFGDGSLAQRASPPRITQPVCGAGRCALHIRDPVRVSLFVKSQLGQLSIDLYVGSAGMLRVLCTWTGTR